MRLEALSRRYNTMFYMPLRVQLRPDCVGRWLALGDRQGTAPLSPPYSTTGRVLAKRGP